MKYLPFVVFTGSLKSGVYFSLITHVSLEQPHVHCSVALYASSHNIDSRVVGLHVGFFLFIFISVFCSYLLKMKTLGIEISLEAFLIVNYF